MAVSNALAVGDVRDQRQCAQLLCYPPHPVTVTVEQRHVGTGRM
ncbi:MAG: hypothetical protein V9E94_01920 [Microthrixaceae bacterium]